MARKHTIRFDARYSDAEAIRAYESRGSLAKAALELGVSPSSLAQRLKLLDYKPIKKAKPSNDDDDGGRERRRKHAKKVRDANRAAKRCLNETKHKRHARPRRGYRKCDTCIAAHKLTR